MKKTRETDEWAEKTIPVLKDLGYLNSKNTLYVFTAFVIGLTFSGVIFYIGWMGWFSDNINQDVQVEPNIDVYSNTTNTYKMNQPVDNFNNFTIYITNFVECPVP